ncbi:hypothetical protein [Streptomyces sp. B1I3]|uniref:hypothetical protein n=1 Tax=Streptomyces sp. B1I3 TaxID=3042264 RepID=UPI00277D79E7|nr:hypothetical protein [Streptomyces sp. B1I3]MDQ0797669.1 hypothetical protein [Streptomyces sp. B1I3]
MAKKKPKKPKGWWVEQRIAKAELAKRVIAAQARRERVYGRVGVTPPRQSSNSVYAMSSGAYR